MHQAVERLFAHIQKVRPLRGSNAGVVYQAVEGTGCCECLLDELVSLLGVGDIGFEDREGLVGIDGSLAAEPLCLSSSYLVSSIVDEYGKAVGCKSETDASSNASAAAGDKNGFCHRNPPYCCMQQYELCSLYPYLSRAFSRS